MPPYFQRLGLLVLRAVPPPVWALVCPFVLYPGVLPGAVALAIYNLGVLGRLMAETVENLEERPQAALHALGATRAGAFLYAALPSAFRGWRPSVSTAGRSSCARP